METVFESDSIRYVRVTEELVKDYLAMVNDIQRVARFIGDRTEAIPEEKELSRYTHRLILPWTAFVLEYYTLFPPSIQGRCCFLR